MEMNILKAQQTDTTVQNSKTGAHRSILLALRPFSFELVADFEIFCIIKNTLNFSLKAQILSQQPLAGAE